jgi:lactoylglutathione lyase
VTGFVYLTATTLAADFLDCASHVSAELENVKARDSRKVLTLAMHHVGLTVRNLEKSVAFFTGVLDWKVAGGFPDYPSQFVTDEKIFLTLWQATDPAAAMKFD